MTFERAKADGAWIALDDVEALVIPEDLPAALTADPAALARGGMSEGGEATCVHLEDAERHVGQGLGLRPLPKGRTIDSIEIGGNPTRPT